MILGLEIFMDEMLHRVPMLGSAEIKSFVNGPESFTPDSKYILGEAPEVKIPGLNDMTYLIMYSLLVIRL